MNSLRRWRCLLLLGGVALLLPGGSGSSSTSHFMRYFYTGMSEPSQGLPEFIAVEYVDDQPITHYDSNAQEKVPVAPWMKKVEKESPEYWSAESHALRVNEYLFKISLVTLQSSYSQTRGTGLHTLQLMYDCEVGPGRQPRVGYWKFGYRGEDFLDFDNETLTWTAHGPQAEISKRKLAPLLNYFKNRKSYLEEKCIEWLPKLLEYGKETLQRTERPTVKVGYDGQETLICWARGFYPDGISINWIKEGEIQNTSKEGVFPNSDGTYSKWLSIEVDPKDRDRYRCHVEHSSLQKPLNLAWEEPASNVGLIVGVVVVLAAVVLGAGIAYYLKKHYCGDKRVPGSDQGSDISMQNLMQSRRDSLNSSSGPLAGEGADETACPSPGCQRWEQGCAPSTAGFTPASGDNSAASPMETELGS